MKGYIITVSLALALVLPAATVLAQHKKVEGPCKTNINLPAHALYKSENVHGGRGPTLITSYGNTRQWPGCGSLRIYNMKAKLVGRFGCYDPGHAPYGRRFYTGVPGGSYSSATSLYNGARRAHSTKIVIDVSPHQNKKTCWIVSNPLRRQGGI